MSLAVSHTSFLMRATSAPMELKIFKLDPVKSLACEVGTETERYLKLGLNQKPSEAGKDNLILVHVYFTHSTLVPGLNGTLPK